MRIFAYGMPRSASTWWWRVWAELGKRIPNLKVYPDYVDEHVAAKHEEFVRIHHRLGKQWLVMAIYRDIRDVLVSWYHKILYDPVHPIDREVKWMSKRQAFDVMIDHPSYAPRLVRWFMGYWGQDFVQMYRFEDITRDPKGFFFPLLTQMDLVLSRKKIHKILDEHTFGNWKVKNPRHYRSGEVGQWRTELSEEQVDRMFRLYGYFFERGGYEQ